MTDTDRDLAVIADYMRRRGGAPLPAGLMASARARALRQAPERDTARTPLAAFWTRGPVAIAGALGALATVAVLLVVLSGLPLGGTDAPAADPSPGGQPSSSPAASPSSTVICGRCRWKHRRAIRCFTWGTDDTTHHDGRNTIPREQRHVGTTNRGARAEA